MVGFQESFPREQNKELSKSSGGIQKSEKIYKKKRSIRVKDSSRVIFRRNSKKSAEKINSESIRKEIREILCPQKFRCRLKPPTKRNQANSRLPPDTFQTPS